MFRDMSWKNVLGQALHSQRSCSRSLSPMVTHHRDDAPDTPRCCVYRRVAHIAGRCMRWCS